MDEQKMLIERSVIGHLYSFYSELKAYIPEMEKSDFEYHAKEFEILSKAYSSGKKYDSVLLLGEAFEAGLRDKIVECCQEASTPLGFKPHYDELFRINSVRRLNEKVINLYHKRDINLETLTRLLDEEKSRSTHSGVHEKTACKIEEYISRLGKKEPRIYTGFSLMDKVLGGFRPGTVCHIGARPSTGKTAFAINIAQKQIHKRVLFFSLEMSTDMIFDRYASNLGEIDYSLFTAQSLTGDDIKKITGIFNTLGEKKNFFVLDDVYNIEAIVSAALKIKPDLIIIDYIQKVGTLKNIPVMRERIEYISGELKKLAKESGSVIVCLSQLSRDSQQAPTMSSLKESGALEADGDYIIILHRPFVLEKKLDVNPQETDVLIDKNKFGETGLIKMLFKGRYQRFTEIDPRYGSRLDDM